MTAEMVARLAQEREWRIGIAESLTGGALSSALAAASNAQQWLAGGLVAYQLVTKRRLLGVEAGVPATSAACAAQMASGVRALLSCDVSVSVTGVGGPGPDDDGNPAGTVYIAVALDDGTMWWDHAFPGSPERVISQSVEAALAHLVEVLDGGASPAA